MIDDHPWHASQFIPPPRNRKSPRRQQVENSKKNSGRSRNRNRNRNRNQNKNREAQAVESSGRNAVAPEKKIKHNKTERRNSAPQANDSPAKENKKRRFKKQRPTPKL